MSITFYTVVMHYTGNFQTFLSWDKSHFYFFTAVGCLKFNEIQWTQRIAKRKYFDILNDSVILWNLKVAYDI